MKFYRHWIRHSGRVRVGGAEQAVNVYGRSDLSADDARADAQRRLAAVQRRIDGEPAPDEAYETAIREEVVQTVDGRNLVSRTRYGALILNSEDTFFIDVDRPPFRFWKSLFAWRGLDDKQRIHAHVADLAATPRYAAYGMRVYETGKGMRVILTGTTAAPDSPEARRILEDFHADPLYARLCAKQRCFRARVSPKPHRVRCRGFKVAWPRDAGEQSALEAWLAEYDAKSARYAVCRFVREYGTPGRSAIVDLHDRLTQAHSGKPLA